MDSKQKQRHILELCAESECGSWEFWSGGDKTEAEGNQIVQAISNLAAERKIYPTEYEFVSDQSYQEVPLNTDRLKNEVEQSMTDTNAVDPKKFYWFLATDKGKKKDLRSRAV